MTAFFILIISIVETILFILTKAWLIQVGWKWFMVAIFPTLHELSFWQAFILSCFGSLFAFRTLTSTEARSALEDHNDSDDLKLKMSFLKFCSFVVGSLLVLLWMFIVKSCFM